MVNAQEKNYQRGLNKDRNVNSDNILKNQGNPEQSIKDMRQSSLSDSLKEVEASQGTPEQSIRNMSSSSVTADDQASIRRRLGQDRLQSRNENKQGANNEGDQSAKNKIGQRGFKEKLSSLGETKSIKGTWQRLKQLQQRNKNKKTRLEMKAGAGEKSKEQIEKLANEAVKKAWMAGHEIVEEFLIANFYVLFLTGPIYLAIVVVRPFFAMVGMMTIKIKGVKVKMIPGYSFNGFFLRVIGVIIILFITALEWIIIIILLYIYTHPWDTLVEFPWQTLKGLWGLVAGYISS